MSKIRVMSNTLGGSWFKGWESRAKNHCDIFMRYNPDVIGVQNLTEQLEEHIKTIEHEFNTAYTRVRYEANAHLNNKTVIFYNAEKLKMIHHDYFFPNKKDFRNFTAYFAVFEEIESQKRFCFMNTELYKFENDKVATVLMDNARDILIFLDWLKNKFKCPIITTGDFNCTPESAPMEKIKSIGHGLANEVADEQSSLCSYCKDFEYNREENRFTYSVDLNETKYEDSIDHILISGNVLVDSFVTVLDEEATNASYHFPIFADIQL